MTDGVAIVTGAGSGIGRAVALALAAAGVRVLAAGLPAGLDTLTAEAGDAVRVFPGDLTDPGMPASVFDAAEAWGPVTVLVNNAGIGASRAVHETSDADLDRYLDVNLRIAFRLSREAVGRMLPRRRGAIVNVASVQGMLGFPSNAAYGTSKAALIGLTRQMSVDYAPAGLRVNAVAPGIVETPLTAERLRGNAGFRAMSVGTTPMGRPGRAAEIAAAILFLASDAASFITGQVLAVDGGASTAVFRGES